MWLMKGKDVTVVKRPDENRTVHRQRKSPPFAAKEVLEHMMGQLKLVILLASVPVLLLVLAGLCVISIGLDQQQFRIGRNTLDV